MLDRSHSRSHSPSNSSSFSLAQLTDKLADAIDDTIDDTIDDELEIRDWLDLDQASDDLDLTPSAPATATASDPFGLGLQPLFPQPAAIALAQDHLPLASPLIDHQRHRQLLHQPHPLALDPSTILAYPPLATADDHQPHLPSIASPAFDLLSLTQPFINILPHPHHPVTPSYALDPALLSASIPSRTALAHHSSSGPGHHPATPTISANRTATAPNLGSAPPPPASTAADHTTDTHTHPATSTTPTPADPAINTTATTPIPSHFGQSQPRLPVIRLPKPKINLSQRSGSHQLPSFKKEDVEPSDPAQSSARHPHSRSCSSSIILDQPFPSPAPTHNRTLSHSHVAHANAPDWEDKPSAEEYKMLSSKEKRQLRNKISARNFRHRRKQHISTLEQQVAQRDKAIESLSNDLGAVRMENSELKLQLEILKQKWADLMKKIEDMSLSTATPTIPSPTHPTSTTNSPPSSSVLMPVSPRMKSTKSTTMITLPNLHKDLGTHTRKPFNGVGGMAGGNVGVHTTLIPEVSVDVYESNPLVSHFNHPGCPLPQSDLSPQALLELKLESSRRSRELSDRMMPRSKVSSQKLERDRSNLKDGLSIKKSVPIAQRSNQSPMLTGQSLDDHRDQELGDRLGEMLYEALKAKGEVDDDDGDDDDDESLSSLRSRIDREKLKGCLDGRLIIQLVERSPPPYSLDPNLLNENPQFNSFFSPAQIQDRSCPSSRSNVEILSRNLTNLLL